ncbi:hypothetical protein C8J56DRAFT_776106 [Mycena floridula]|nr:hypothetical protein C8J56DRAFT_776106 [Mycena floridula]
MADVRALLKAKREETRITHPLASYNQNGQLRCSVCGTLVKHASAWEGHLGSKGHRTTVAKLKEEARAQEEQRLKQEREAIARGKRKLEEEDEDEEEEETAKKPRVDDSTFPSDFFSDSSRALPTADDDEEEEEAVVEEKEVSKPAVDLEWERFQREVVNAPVDDDRREQYESATIMAEPVLVSQTEGMPMAEEEVVEPTKLTDEEERRKKEQDDKELIMDRLLEEERVQEEADMKVVALKNRLEALKKKRAAKVKAS